MIQVDKMGKTFTSHVVKPGLFGNIAGFFTQERREFRAVDSISFTIHPGEFVGYLGPNGAGKSTTIKILTGILVPSDGRVTVNGIEPYRERTRHARQIGVVFGQRTQLWWDLPPLDAFHLLGKVYRVDKTQLRQRIDFFVQTLGLGEFLDQPVRKLSLGQRMRCELTAALLHEPKILFLDEPTIGLDINAKEAIRGFLKDLNRNKGTTILLTTHDLGDVEELCRRVIVIDRGQIIHDSTLAALRSRFGNQREALLDLEEDNPVALPPHAALTKREGKRLWVEFDGDRLRVPELLQYVMKQSGVNDLSIREVDIERVVKRIYGGA